MIKYIFIILACISPLYASESPILPGFSSLEADYPENSTEPTNTANQIDLIINHLENTILLLDNPNSSLIQENMNNIEALVRPLVVKLMALIKIGKLTEYGVEHVQALKLFRIYASFKTKLSSMSRNTEINPEPKNAQSLT